MTKQNTKNNAEILCIGTELLLGNIVNSNARWISEELSYIGLEHYQQIVIGDNIERIQKTIIDASKRCRFLIVTGGLGPTPDDLTTEAIASVFKSELKERKEIWIEIQAKLRANGHSPSPSNRKQALMPKEALVIPNPIGTAPGIIWSPLPDFTILTFPGVPSEMKRMWKETAVDWLKSNTNNTQILLSKVLKFTGISESKLAELLEDLMNKKNPTLAPYAGLGEVKLRITAMSETKEKGINLITPLITEIVKRTGETLFGFDEESLSSVVLKLLRQRNETICIAESCTGGGLGASLASIPGASDMFLGGVIAYNNSVKRNLLKVPSQLIQEHGAVSKQVVTAMAEGARKVFGADWAIAITGIAGPGGGTKQKPLGLVYLALTSCEGTKISQLKFDKAKDRQVIQQLSVLRALNLLRLSLISRS